GVLRRRADHRGDRRAGARRRAGGTGSGRPGGGQARPVDAIMAAWPACPTPSSTIAPPRTRIVTPVGAPQRVAGPGPPGPRPGRPAQRPGCRGPAEMARLSDAFIDDLLARTDIVEVVNARVPLKRQGKEYSARCPFHDERSPSFTVSPTKQFYHCFGCGAHGTAISFLMQYDRLEFLDAVDELARQAGMEVPRETQQRNANP